MGLLSWIFGGDDAAPPPGRGEIPARFRSDGPPEDGPPEDEPRAIPLTDELDLHTFRPREARSLVATYLEEARSAGFTQVRVVHGKGTGTLRKSIQSLLKRHPSVQTFEDAPPHRGGWGATMVHLRPLEDAALEPAPPRADADTDPRDTQEEPPR